jgi:hypothetical protein
MKPVAGLAVAAIAAIALLPPILFPPEPSVAPSEVVVVPTPTLEVTATPAPLTAPPTAEPTPEIFGPPDELVAAGDEAGFGDAMTLSFKCPPNDPCRDDIKTRVEQILANLADNASGAQLVKFSTTVAGTLPIVASWDNRYKYTVGGTEFFAKEVAIDLAPRLSGKPAYAYIKDENGTSHWYTIPDGNSEVLLNDMYNLPVPAPTPDPNVGGGGVVLYRDFYQVATYNGLLLQTIQFAATPPP